MTETNLSTSQPDNLPNGDAQAMQLHSSGGDEDDGVQAKDNQAFLYDLFGDIEEPNRILVWRMRKKDGEFFKESDWFASAHDASLYANGPVCQDCDVYFGLGIAPRSYGPHNRCPANEVVGIPGFWLDLDIKGDNHADQNLPETEEAAMALLAEFPLPPSFVVRSGGGMHAYWKFAEPWMFDTIAERRRAGEATKAFVDTFRAAARQHGFKVDAVHDLARILRVPGTLNHKTDPPRDVELIVASGKEYQPSEFEDFFVSLEDGGQSLFDEPIMYTVGNLTLNPEAQPPIKILVALENEEKFKLSWEHKRRDLDDQSASSYDMSIANMAVGYGWTDQEIVDTLIARHSKYNENDPKLNRLDYYKTTITKARQSARREMALENLEMLPEVTVSEAPDTDIRKRALENLRIRLELNITRVVKYNSDPPQYELFTQQGNIRLKSIDG